MAILIETSDPVEWHGLQFSLFCNTILSPDIQEDLHSLIRSWTLMCLYGAWGGYPNYITEIGFVEEGDHHVVEWLMDMGGLEPGVVDLLAACLQRFQVLRGIQLDKLVLGQRYDE